MISRLGPVTVLAVAIAAGIAPPADAQTQKKNVQCTVREGVEFYRMKNYGKALNCWEENARVGSSAAQYNIARMYALGEGVPHSKVQAFKWMTIAARSGRSEANKALDQIRATMTDVEIDEAQRRIAEFYSSGRR